MTDSAAHAPHDALAALLHDDLDERGRAVVRHLYDRDARRLRRAVVELDAFSQPLQRARRRHAVDFGEIFLLDAVPRMREQLREFAVVREDQEALGITVEPPDWEHAR